MARISDYALIGDCHSAALVGRDGSIDWASFPFFDSPSVFCRILDELRGGFFIVRPDHVRSVRRSYLDDTNVLVTVFECPKGEVELADCMPIARLDPEHPTEVAGFAAILRRVRCLRGEVEVRAEVAARFEYGSFVPRFRLTSEYTCEIVGGGDALWLTSTRPLRVEDTRAVGTWCLREGEEVWLEVAWTDAFVEKDPSEHPGELDLRQRFDGTVEFWREWIAQCAYEGEHEREVRRSALVLKALTFAPTGAVVAAPTTSLPEEIGGMRNWDYRYTWIRDTTLALISLMILGFRAEADAFRQWIRRTSSGRPEDLQIMYSIHGHRTLPELELSHLAGHRGSRPVRIGNGAVKQLQLDVYGQLLEAAYLYCKVGGTISPTNWDFLRGLTEIVCEQWRNPDQGIWEVRDRPRHFVHSKAFCWVALDRGLAISKLRDLPAPVEKWQQARDAIHDCLMEAATRQGCFSQALDVDRMDASVLLLPAMGFVPARHPIMLETIERVRAELETDGLLHRYRSRDGLQGGEGSFLLCSFWLADALLHAGQQEEAEHIVDRLLSLANDVGLWGEEAEPETGEALGNFPQAFTHMALVTTCAHLTAARKGELPREGAYDFSEFALGRLLGRKS